MSERYQENQVPSQVGKTAFVTGANTGIGYDTARVLAEKGARVLLGCRDEQRAIKAMDAIRVRVPSANLAWIELDLTSLASIRSASEQVLAEEHLDLLVNKRGASWCRRKHLPKMGLNCSLGLIILGTLP